jgi:hypothetical protein
MDEVDAATQAEMAVRLSDNVRELVRKHMSEALNDGDFMSRMNTYTLQTGVMRGAELNPVFVNAVKAAIVAQMNKY